MPSGTGSGVRAAAGDAVLVLVAAVSEAGAFAVQPDTAMAVTPARVAASQAHERGVARSSTPVSRIEPSIPLCQGISPNMPHLYTEKLSDRRL